MRRTVALGAAGAALAAAAVGGVAFAADSSGSTPTTAVQTTAAQTTAAPTTTAASTGTPSNKHAGHHRRRALAARALHGSLTVQRKTGPAVVDVQRGQVTTSNPTSVTVHSTDGFEATYAVNSATRIRKDKKPATTAALTPGSEVGVVADDAGGHPVARVIRVAG